MEEQRPSASLTRLATEIRGVLRTDRDFLVAITGMTGQGKSVLAQHLAKKVDPKFEIRKQTVFTREEFTSLIKDPEQIPQYGAVIVDEAVNVLFRRDFMHKGQKELLRLLDMIRYRNLLMILCLPNIWSLDKHILDSRLRAWLFVQDRGLAYLFVPDENPFTEDRWHRKINEKKLKYWSHGVTPTKSQNFLGEVEFGDLDKQTKIEYLAVKDFKKENAEKYGMEATVKKEHDEKLAVSLLHQLYSAGKLKKADLKEIAPSVAKSFNGLMTKFGNLEKASDARNQAVEGLSSLKGKPSLSGSENRDRGEALR